MTEIQRLERRLQTMQSNVARASARAASNISRQMNAQTTMPVILDGPLRQMDELTRRIQKGKISAQEFNDTWKRNNGLLEYQNRLANANLETFRKIGNGRWTADLNIPQLQRHRSMLQLNATEWKTMEAAAKSYGRTVMDQGKNMAFMGRQALLSVTAPLVGLGAATAVAFYQVDKGLTNVAKVYGDANDAVQLSTDQIRAATMDLAKSLNNSLGTSVDDTLELAGAFAALGETGSNLDAMTTQAARLMKLGDVTTESATKMISTLRTVFKLSGTELREAIDFANEMENSTTLQMQDFSDALPKLGPIVQSWGGDIREAGVILEAFTRAGIPAVEGANALKSGFASLARTTPQLRNMWKEMTGGGSLDAIVKQFKGNVPEILAEIGRIQDEQAWDTSKRQTFAAQLWGKNQLARGMALTENLSTGGDRAIAVSKKTAAELAAIADAEIKKIMESASSQFSVAINNLKIMGAEIGSRVLPLITKFLNTTMAVATTIADVYKGTIDALGPLGDFLNSALKIGVVLAAAMGPAMLLIASLKLIQGALISGVLGNMARMFSKIKSEGISPRLSTAQQRANALVAAEERKQQQSLLNSRTSAEAQATQRLTTALNSLAASYDRANAAAARASTTTARATDAYNRAAITAADQKRQAYLATLNTARASTAATQANNKATAQSTTVIASQNRAMREQWQLRREGLRLNRAGAPVAPPRETLTSPGGTVFTRNTRSGEIQRVNNNGNRVPLNSARSNAALQARFDSARNAQLAASAQARIASTMPAGINPSVNAAALQQVIAAQSRVMQGQTQINLAQRAFSTYSNASAQVLNRQVVGAYSSILSRQQSNLQIQQRITAEAQRTAAANAAAARAAAWQAQRAARNDPATRGGNGTITVGAQQGVRDRWAAAQERMRNPQQAADGARMNLPQQQAAINAERVAAANAAAADRAGDMANKFGAIAMTAGMVTSLMGSTSQTMQVIASTAMTAGFALMTLGTVFPGMLAKMGESFKNAFASMPAAAGGATGKIGAMFTKLGGVLMAALPWAALAAAGAAAIYGVYRLATTESRKLREENDRIKNSIEGWTKLLNLAPTSFGQVIGKDGEAEDTITSLIAQAREDEGLSALIDKLKRNSDDMQAMRDELEREAVKMAARGATSEQIATGLETVMRAADLPPQVIDQLKVEFKDITVSGLNGSDLSKGVTDQLDQLFNNRENRTQSMLQQVMDFSGDDLPELKLSQQAKTEIDDIFTQMENELAAADPELRGNLFESWREGLMESLDTTLDQLKPDVANEIREKGLLNVDLGGMLDAGRIDRGQFEQLTYQTNVMSEFLARMGEGSDSANAAVQAMMSDVGSASVLMASRTKTAFMTMQDATGAFQSKVASLGDAWKNMSEEDKISLLNFYRLAAGLKAIEGEAAKAAISANNLGPEIREVSQEAIDAEKSVEELNEEFGFGRTADWNIRVNVEGLGEFANVDDFISKQKDIMKGALDDVMDEMQYEFEQQYAASERSREAAQQAESDALKDRQSAESKAFEKGQEAEQRAFDKSQEEQKRSFDDNWDARIEAEKKGFEDRIKAIEDTQEAEDELERQRKRNAEREERRLKYLQSLMQSNIDYNAAMAGGDLDEAARISLNAATASTDYANQTSEAEAGYKKEDEDRARSKQIEAIKLEEEERIKALERQREAESRALQERQEAERLALEERMAMQSEEFQRRQEAEQKYLQNKQAQEDLAAELSFQANQRALNRELEALRTQIPLNEAELRAHIGRVAEAYDAHGGNLMTKGDYWSKVIEDSLIRRVDNARNEMSNEEAWRAYGNRVANGASQGAFNMSASEFNHFLRTGELPQSQIPKRGDPLNPYEGGFRHGGGPIGGGGYDKYNNRKGITGGLRRDERPIIAQDGEFMMNKKAVNNYGTDLMHQINSGTFNPGNTGGAYVGNVNAIGGFGELNAALSGIMVGAIISRTVEAAGSAMMAAVSGGGDIGSINIPQKAGVYGNSTLSETQLKTAALIAEAAKEVGASKRDLTIALMTAFQESAMGTMGMYTAVDHDSLGAFQQRAAWGPAADRIDIKKSAKMFFLGGQAGQPGLFDIANRNAMSLGQAAQTVQVSAHPSAYDKWQDEAEAIIAAGVGTDISRRELANNLRFGGWTTAGIQAYADKWASSAVGSGGPMNVQPGEYQHPVPGAVMTSGYGMRWGSLHDGIDFGAPIGTPIYATKAGTVTFASTWDDGGFGMHTVVDHGGGITSGYAHQSRLAVGVGQKVQKGQNIGFVGNTGQSTGPHLHFQLGRGSSGGKYQYTTDPAQFGIPGLRVGGIIGYDNTIANLHKDETVLTAPLSKSLQDGIRNLENNNVSGDIKFELNINAPVYGVNDMQAMFDKFKEEVKEELRREELTKQRRLGNR